MTEPPSQGQADACSFTPEAVSSETRLAKLFPSTRPVSSRDVSIDEDDDQTGSDENIHVNMLTAVQGRATSTL